MRTASERAKDVGMKNLKEVSELSGASTQNLNNWLDKKPDLFEVVLLGCVEKKNSLAANETKVNKERKMTKIEKIQRITSETQKLEQLQSKAEQAKSSADSAIERDVDRTDGSERQDRLHEQFLKETIGESHEASAAYEKQEKLVKELMEQL